MATNFPTSLDAPSNPTANDPLNAPSHSAQHTNANDAIKALETKVGVDSSAVTTSHDYLLAKRTAALTNTGDLLYASAANTPARLGIGTAGQVLGVNAGATAPAWQNAGHRSFKSGNWYLPVDHHTGSDGVDTEGKNVLVLLPFPVGVTTTFDRIGTYLSTAQPNTNVRLGIYNTVGGVPSALLVDSGVIDTTAGAGAVVAATITQTLQPGLYWLATVWQGTGATMPSITMLGVANANPENFGVSATNMAHGHSLSLFYENGDPVSGALPATITIGTGNSNPIRACWLRAQ